jgi:hypothetical protein
LHAGIEEEFQPLEFVSSKQIAINYENNAAFDPDE